MYRLVIALRYLKTRRITYLSILGVAVGVAALIIVMAVMEGFQNDFKSRIRGILSDVIVRYRGDLPADEVERRIGSAPHVEAVSPRLRGMALIIGDGGRGAVEIIGVDMEKEIRVSKLAEYVINSRITSQAKEHAMVIDDVVLNLRMALAPKKMSAEGMPAPLRAPFRSLDRRTRMLKARLNKESKPRVMVNILDQARDEILAFLDVAARCPDLDGGLRTALEAYKSQVRAGFEEKVDAIDRARRSCAGALDRYRETGAFDSPFEDDGEVKEIILGEELMGSLYVRPGDTVRVYTSGAKDLGSLEDESSLPEGRFKVAATFRSRMYRYDSRLVYMPLATAQAFQAKEGLISEYAVRLDDFANASAVKRALRERLPGADVQTWADKRRTLLAAIDLEKAFLSVVLFMIIVVAGFNMLATFLMMVTEKTRDLGILKALGGSTLGISSIFFLCGVLISVAGSALGTGIGLLFVRYINEIEDFVHATTGITPFPREVYYLDAIPTVVDTADIAWILLPTIVVSVVLGSVLPALKASRLSPQQALRYE